MASSLTKRLDTLNPWLRLAQLRFARTESGPPRRRSKSPSFSMTKPNKEKSEWWIVDGEMHEIGDHVPPRERFVIPRDNIPNKRRKQLREQFMRRTRLVLKDSVSLSLTLFKPTACCSWNLKKKIQKQKSVFNFFIYFLWMERSMRCFAKGTWSCIRSWGRIGRGFIGTKATRRN